MNESPGPLNAWYHVRFDDSGITRDVRALGRDPWTDFVAWDKIIRVCFKTAEDFFSSDEIYIFSNERPESYLIPMEADGALETWNQIIHRGLFDAELAIKMASSSGKIACWPNPEKN